MTKHHLYVLITVAIVALISGLWVSEIRETGTEDEHESFVPGLKETINDVTELRIFGAGDKETVTVRRGDSRWTVTQVHGYPANTAKLRESLLDLAAARVLESKTSKAENYPQLGVEDLELEDATGVRVELSGSKHPVSVILGKTATSGTGRYARRATEDTSLLVAGTLRFETDPNAWLNNDLVNVAAERIRTISVSHADGETLSIAKDDPTQTVFDVLNVPADRELLAPTVANSLSQAWNELKFDEVMPKAELPSDQDAIVTTTLTTFDGLVITTKAYALEDTQYFALEARFDAPVNPDGEESAVDEQESADPDATKDDSLQDSVVTGTEDERYDASEQARDISARTNGWLYRIPSYKSKQLTKTMDDLLKSSE